MVASTATPQNCFSSQETQVPQKPTTQRCFKGQKNTNTYKVSSQIQLVYLQTGNHSLTSQRSHCRHTSLLKKCLHLLMERDVLCPVLTFYMETLQGNHSNSWPNQTQLLIPLPNLTSSEFQFQFLNCKKKSKYFFYFFFFFFFFFTSEHVCKDIWIPTMFP